LRPPFSTTASVAFANISDEVECKNGPPAVTVTERLDMRIIACFNYQQDMAQKREVALKKYLDRLEARVTALEQR
jgi:uncharacterized protein YodC (DUF2158 family)